MHLIDGKSGGMALLPHSFRAYKNAGNAFKLRKMSTHERESMSCARSRNALLAAPFVVPPHLLR